MCDLPNYVVLNSEFSSYVNLSALSMKYNQSDLAVKKTTLKDCEFLGLFAGKNFSQGEIVCQYTGSLLRTKEALRLEDKSYLMRLGEQCYIDAKDHLEVYARYINDCINPHGWNVIFDKHPEGGYANVIALRDISDGEELFVDYGKWYWIKKSPVKMMRNPS